MKCTQRDDERVEHGRNVVGEIALCVVAGDRTAAAVANACLYASTRQAGLQQRRQLFGPHAAVGREGVRHADHGRGFRTVDCHRACCVR